MKRKGLLLLFIFIFMFGVTGCKKSDALKFKEEYESLNGTKNDSGKTIRTVSIDKANPIRYASEDDIVQMVKNKKSFIVYFGFASCPWCRSVLPNLLRVSKDLGIDTIYYVDVLHIRNSMKLDDHGEVIMDQEGTKGYYELLKIFDGVLSDYTLKNDNGENVSTGMKRIYAPNIISVVDGEVKEMTTGISSRQSDGYMKLTKEMNQESYDMIKCSVQCVVDSKNSCSSKSMC